MQFSTHFIEEVNSRIKLSDIIGSRVKLKHQTGSTYKGLCPFHQEKSPSFNVDDAKGFYHCFGCGVGGNAIKFVMETQGLSFVETMTKLAGIAGMEVPKIDKFAQEKYKKQLSLYDLCEEATNYFARQLFLTAGKVALSYLRQRGVSDDAIKVWRLGYSPNGRSGVKAAMLKKGYTEQQLADVGLIIVPEGKSVKDGFDRFRNRLMFPITDFKGRSIAFGGRILGDGQPKYLNSPETELFHKSDVLYGFDLARQSAYDSEEIITVEGYMDVIAMYDVGIKNVVAPLGTALTQAQIRILWKVSKEPILCLDGDVAGQRAMLRAANNSLSILEAGYSLRFATLPAGKDPDDVIKENGVAELKEVLSNTGTLSDLLWKNTQQQCRVNGDGNNTPEQKAYFEQKLMAIVGEIKNSSVAHYYQKHFKDKLWDLGRRKNSGNYNKFTPKKNFSQNGSSAKGYNNNNMGTQYQGSNYQGSNYQGTGIIANQPSLVKLTNLERYEILLVVAGYFHPQLLLNVQWCDEYLHMELQDSGLNNIRDIVVEMVEQYNESAGQSIQGSDADELTYNDVQSYVFENNPDIVRDVQYQEKRMVLDPSLGQGANISVATVAFDYFFALYRMEILDKEYKILASSSQTMSDSELERLNELKKQKDELKRLVKVKYLEYEEMLDI